MFLTVGVRPVWSILENMYVTPKIFGVELGHLQQLSFEAKNCGVKLWRIKYKLSSLEYGVLDSFAGLLWLFLFDIFTIF